MSTILTKVEIHFAISLYLDDIVPVMVTDSYTRFISGEKKILF